MADKPVTREEKYLAYLTGDYKGELPKPITRKEKYLYELCLKGIGGEISPEEIKNAVNEYLEKNPVKPGATTEQAQQIEQNKTDIASLKVETGSLKEDKITKPAEAPTIGKILRVKSVNEDGTFTCEWADDGGSNLDVRIDGKSIVQDGVAEIPVAVGNMPGTYYGLVHMVSGYCYGITTGNAVVSPGVWTNDALKLVEPGNFGIDYRKPASLNGFGAINTTNFDYAIKAAMCDGKGAAWTADEQAAARERMGAWTTIADITLDEDVNIINAVSVQGYRKYSVVVLLSQPITVDCYIQPNLICGDSASGAAYESAKDKTFLFFDIEEFGYIGGENNSSLFGCESYKSETGAVSSDVFKYSTLKVNYNIAGKFPYLTGIGVIVSGASIPSGSRMIIRGHN